MVPPALGPRGAQGGRGSGGLRPSGSPVSHLPDSNTCWMRIPSTAPQAPGTSPDDTVTALWTEVDMV